MKSIAVMKQKQFNVMAKPTSYSCNLKCDYCFYLEKEDMFNGVSPVMSDAALKRFTKSYIESQPTDLIEFVWQGGEPTLAGLDFYKKAVKYQNQYGVGKIITNSFQTNAIAINKQWAEFFKEHNFLLGVSIDGPNYIHDRYRISTNGRPTFEKVKSSINLLKEYGVDFNTLTVVNDQNWNKGKETYSLLKELGVEHMQFIPVVEVMEENNNCNNGVYTVSPDAKITPFSVPAHGYGEFMSEVFDEWVSKDIGRVFVQAFESILSTWIGQGATICHQAPVCGTALVIEQNGDVYSCDHYVYPVYKLGNIAEKSIEQLGTSKQQQRFGTSKNKKLTSECEVCFYKSLCNAGCPKHRFVKVEHEKNKQNYLCPSYKHLFKKTAHAMQLMVKEIQSGGHPSNIMPLFYNNRA